MGVIITFWVASFLAVVLPWIVGGIRYRRDVKALNEDFMETEAKYDRWEELIKSGKL